MKRFSLKKIRSWVVRAIIKLIVAVFCFTLFQVVCLKYVNPITTPNVAWEWAESIIEKDRSKRPVYIFKPIEEISPHLQRAVLAAEDQRFLVHGGFDFNEIKHALKTLIKRKKLRGASTISMQTSRSVFLLSSKSVFRKMAELYYTILIELIWDKKRILEIYLNTVDWGTGVTGAEAASLKYFNKSCKLLSPSQAALMTAILPNPHRWSAKHPSSYIKHRQKKILQMMGQMPVL